MKLKLHVLLPLLLIALVAGGLLVLHKQSKGGFTSTRTAPRGTPEKDGPPGRLETDPVPPKRDTPRDSSTRVPSSGLVDRLLVTRSPAEFGRIADELSASSLSEQDLERLREIARGGASGHHRLIAIQVLSKRADPDGKTLAALRDAVGVSDEMISHSALASLRDYVQANPKSSGEVNAYLLGRAGSSSDEEFRQIAVTAINVDTLQESDYRLFAGMLNDSSEDVRCAVIHSLSRSSHRDQTFQTLGNAFTTDPSDRVKRHILSVLVEMGRDARPTIVSLKGRSSELDPEIDEALQHLDSPQ